jgi:hypothetical protein
MGDPVSHDRSSLFLRNYAKVSALHPRERLSAALEAAVRGESLHVTNRLLVVDSDGRETWAVQIDGAHRLRSGAVIGGGIAPLAVLWSDTGFQVSRMVYDLVEHPALRAANVDWPPRTERAACGFRGLVAVDLVSRRVAWEYECGVSTLPTAFGDVNGDGCPEIVLATYASMNGASAGGETDTDCSYVLCLDTFGNEIWKHRAVGSFLGGHPAIGDVTSDVSDEVVAIVGSKIDTTYGSVAILDGSGNTLRKKEFSRRLSGLILVDVVGDEKCEIVTGTSRGSLIVLDGNLEVVGTYRDTAHAGYQDKQLVPLVANDLDGDGSMELISLSFGWSIGWWSPRGWERVIEYDPASYIIVLSAELDEEARARLPEVDGRLPEFDGGTPPRNSAVVDLDGNGVNEIIAATNTALYVFGLVERGDGS